MLDDILILSLVFVACLAVTLIYVARALRRMRRPREQIGQVTVHVEDLPRPLDTRGSIRVLQMSERIEVEERYVTRLLREIEDLERSGGG